MPKQHCHIKLYTEENRDGTIFRAHGNYRGITKWHDWVMVRFNADARRKQRTRFETTHGDYNCCAPDYGDHTVDEQEKESYCYAPSRIIGFVMDDDTKERYAIANVCDYNCVKSSVFTNRWKLSLDPKGKANVYLVDVEAIVRHCLMIPEDLDASPSQYWHEVWDMERWADQFHEVH